MVRRVTVVALLVPWGAGRAEAMFGNTGGALYCVPIIGWGDFARAHVTADMAGFQAHPEYLLRSIHRHSDFKLDASDDALGVAYSCMMAAGSFGVWVQTSSVLREYRNKHPSAEGLRNTWPLLEGCATRSAARSPTSPSSDATLASRQARASLATTSQ